MNWKWILGLAAVGGLGYWFYTKNQPATAALPNTGQVGPQVFTASQNGQSIAMKIGDNLSVTIPGITGSPTITGADVFNGSETVFASGGSANAVNAGTEQLTWPGGQTLTVTAS